jgi:DNA (cytosine-5)-methyltransferase 1
MKSNLNTVSLFSGCGGLDIGFEAANFSVKFMADILKEAVETLRHNHPNTFVYGPPFYSGDISELDSDFILTNTTMKKGEIDMMIGGPPCQPFSVAAAQRFLKTDDRFKRRGFECDDKGILIFEYLRLIKELKPKAFLIENVPGIIKIDNGKTIQSLKTIFEDLGYKIKIAIVDAADFGVPQNRKRAIIVGNLLGVEFIFPTGMFVLAPLDTTKYRTVAQALVNIDDSIPNHITREHSIDSINRYRMLQFGYRDHLGRVDRLNPNLPSKTVIAGGSKGGGRSHLHPFLARTLSVRESARLQTFPDSYLFCGSIARQFTQVGNAVPPLLAEHLARSIGEQIFKIKYTKRLTHLNDYLPYDKAFELLLKEAASSNKYVLYDDIKF